MNMGVTYPQAREGRITAAITTAGTADTKAAIMAAAMTRDPDRAVKTIGTAGIMTAATAAITAAMTRDPDKAVETKGTAGIMTAATAAAMTRDPAAVMMITGMITEEMLPTDSPAL